MGVSSKRRVEKHAALLRGERILIKKRRRPRWFGGEYRVVVRRTIESKSHPTLYGGYRTVASTTFIQRLDGGDPGHERGAGLCGWEAKAGDALSSRPRSVGSSLEAITTRTSPTGFTRVSSAAQPLSQERLMGLPHDRRPLPLDKGSQGRYIVQSTPPWAAGHSKNRDRVCGPLLARSGRVSRSGFLVWQQRQDGTAACGAERGGSTNGRLIPGPGGCAAERHKMAVPAGKVRVTTSTVDRCR